MRSDGSIGFPGGFTKNRGEIVSESAEIVDNLNRELSEEINLDKKHFTTKKDYILTMLCNETKTICHCFAKEVSIEDFISMEKNALDAVHYGVEVSFFPQYQLFTYYIYIISSLISAIGVDRWWLGNAPGLGFPQVSQNVLNIKI